jgi:hypothetical protein
MLPCVHVKKSHVWTTRQFFHFLVLNQWTSKNIARDLPYPKIEKTIPKFLTIEEYNQIVRHFSYRADSPMELRNLITNMHHLKMPENLSRSLFLPICCLDDDSTHAKSILYPHETD